MDSLSSEYNSILTGSSTFFGGVAHPPLYFQALSVYLLLHIPLSDCSLFSSNC